MRLQRRNINLRMLEGPPWGIRCFILFDRIFPPNIIFHFCLLSDAQSLQWLFSFDSSSKIQECHYVLHFKCQSLLRKWRWKVRSYLEKKKIWYPFLWKIFICVPETILAPPFLHILFDHSASQFGWSNLIHNTTFRRAMFLVVFNEAKKTGF